MKIIADYANGDARVALNTLEMLLQAKVRGKDNQKSSLPPLISKSEITEGIVSPIDVEKLFLQDNQFKKRYTMQSNFAFLLSPVKLWVQEERRFHVFLKIVVRTF